MKVALNGFGRIGRTVLRQILARDDDVQVVHVNDIAPLETCAHLFAYDSTFGPWPGRVETRGGMLCVDGTDIAFSRQSDLTRVDLSGIDVVMECTGIARNCDIAARGLAAGARAVLISGPSPGADVTVVLGANDDSLGAARIVSNASCTTNAAAPLLALLDRYRGIAHAHMTTIHCYTNSQPMVDAPRGDLARSRGGAQSMVPTTTSATGLIAEILPHLADRISGAAVRVPVPSVSAVDLVVRFRDDIDAATFPDDLRALAELNPVMGHTDLPLVSSDLRARPESLILAMPETLVTGARQARIFGWYDNEWGFSARMIDMARRMAARQ